MIFVQALESTNSLLNVFGLEKSHSPSVEVVLYSRKGFYKMVHKMSMVLAVLAVQRGVAQHEFLILLGVPAGSAPGGLVHFAAISVPLFSLTLL